MGWEWSLVGFIYDFHLAAAASFGGMHLVGIT